MLTHRRMLRLLVLPLLLSVALTSFVGCNKDQSDGKGQQSVEQRKENKLKSDK
jgi:hypothetical protein